MKTLTTILAAAVVAFSAATAAATTSPTYIAHQTKVFYNQRLALAGIHIRLASVRCIRETETDYYCVGKLTGPGGHKCIWNDVSVDADGVITWAKPVVL